MPNVHRHVHTIKAQDVGKPYLRIEGRSWSVPDFIGQIFPDDVGKRVFLVGDAESPFLQVESNEQRDKRQARERDAERHPWTGAPAPSVPEGQKRTINKVPQCVVDALNAAHTALDKVSCEVAYGDDIAAEPLDKIEAALKELGLPIPESEDEEDDEDETDVN